MAEYTPESESQEILIQQQKDLITQTSSSSSSSTIDEKDEKDPIFDGKDRVFDGDDEKDRVFDGDDDDKDQIFDDEEEDEEEKEEEVILWKPKPRKKRAPQVCLQGYVEVDDDELPRTKSLTDDDLDELKGCVDLGFGFSYDEIPELCNTLPALELCYSMSQKFLDDHPNHQQSQSHQQLHQSNGKNGGASDSASSSGSESSSPMPTWKISSPGDHPEDVKARLKFWAQAVACTVRLCS